MILQINAFNVFCRKGVRSGVAAPLQRLSKGWNWGLTGPSAGCVRQYYRLSDVCQQGHVMSVTQGR